MIPSGGSGQGQGNGHALPQGFGHRSRRNRRPRVAAAATSYFPPQFQGLPSEATAVAPPTDYDRAYFQSYSHVGIHEEMIKDRVRTETYRSAITHLRNYISGKIVVDVGCGTGILSIFCAQAGAKRVYAVEASDIAVQASQVVEANNLSGKVIVLHGRVEDVQISEKVDVIISEWMGYMLLYESMLGSVIAARDRWLKPVSAIVPLAKQCAFEEPSVETITGENVLTWPCAIKHVDCHTVTIKELESVTAKYRFTSMMQAPLHGFAFWFDVEFNPPQTYRASDDLSGHDSSHLSCSQRKRPKPDGPVLSTAPEDEPTHWQQTLLYFYDPIEVKQDQVIEGSVTLYQSKENARFLNIHLECSSGGRLFVKESVLR